MAGARHFRELDCWQLARELKIKLYDLSDSGPVKKDFRFREELRDAAASAPHNIAEGFGRRTNREFAHFLDIARGSLMECQDIFKTRWTEDIWDLRNSRPLMPWRNGRAAPSQACSAISEGGSANA